MAGVELVETVSNNWDGQTDDKNSEDCTKAAKYLSEAVLWDDITITDLKYVMNECLFCSGVGFLKILDILDPGILFEYNFQTV